jgi:hypothetical protein
MIEQARLGERVNSCRWFRWPVAAVSVGLIAVIGCQGSVGDRPHSPGTGGSGATGPGGAGQDGAPCTGTDVILAKRVVRLSFNQIENSIRSVLGNPIADQIATNYQIADAQHRTFPPLSNPREGSVVTDTVWNIDDQIAQEVAQYVFTNFAAATGCATATDACAQAYVSALTSKAFRHPASTDEVAAIMKVYTDDKSFGGTVQEAAQYSIYAILSTPQFLYRTEFGSDAMVNGPLMPYELASAISYFLTDAPPDAPLLSAAAGGALATADQVRTQVARVAATPEARANLEAAMFSYFAIPVIETIVIDTNLFPIWSEPLRNSMRHESELFLHDTLWNGKIGDLLSSNKSRINASLASLYGITPFPQAGATPDSDGFALTQLPSTRSGIMTQSGFLVARARPNAGSVVGRGLLVNAAILCGTNPAFPAAQATTISAISTMLAGATERDKAAYRADPMHFCSACHPGFDPFGLALENYDTIGRYRTVDDQGRPIDASVTLPANAGGKTVTNAVEMASVMASGGAFATCIANNVIAYALAEVTSGTSISACATQDITKAVAASDGTFTSLVTEVAVSQTLGVRSAGGAQ